MAAIESLLGPLDPADLGVVAFHECLLYGRTGWQYDPDAPFDRAEAFERLLGYLKDFRKAGGKTLVDTSGISMGRNVPMYKRLAELSDVHIVCSTGFVSQQRSIPAHFSLIGYFYRGHGPFQWRREVPGAPAPSHAGTKEYMMFLFYNELTQGMAAPAMIRSTSRAAFTRCGSTHDDISIAEEQAIRGAAIAARKTGTVVFTDGVGQCQRHMELVCQEEGVHPTRIVVGHCDDARVLDLDRDMRLASEGSYIAYDHVGWDERSPPHGMSDDQRAAMVKKMVDAGFADRLILSCSAIGCGLGIGATRHRYDHLLRDFVPRLERLGVGESTIHTMLVENTRKLLTPIRPDNRDSDRINDFAQGFRTMAE